MVGCAPEEYEVEVQADPEEAGEISGEGIYEEGEDVTVEAESEEGYEFIEWEKDGKEIDEKSFEFEIEEDTEVLVNFRGILIPDDNLKEIIREELGKVIKGRPGKQATATAHYPYTVKNKIGI